MTPSPETCERVAELLLDEAKALRLQCTVGGKKEWGCWGCKGGCVRHRKHDEFIELAVKLRGAN